MSGLFILQPSLVANRGAKVGSTIRLCWFVAGQDCSHMIHT